MRLEEAANVGLLCSMKKGKRLVTQVADIIGDFWLV
jgi:hypothetical protein